MKKQYDAVIVGAGLSGLVAGCYLSRGGASVLVVEKNYQAGGYCSSFKRKGFIFDSSAHSLGSCRVDGQFGKIFEDFKLDHVIGRANPSDAVIRHDETYYIPNGFNNIIKEFQSKFPSQKAEVESFFELINNFDINSSLSCMSYYRKFAHRTFSSLLDEYFKDNELKLVLSTFLGNTGLPAHYVGCLSALGIFKEFVIDGGYYVKGGMQKLVDLFLGEIRKNNGEMRFSAEVKQILIENGRAIGVHLDDGEPVASRSVVVASDVKTAFFDMIDRRYLASAVADNINKMRPSVSAFIVYLGLKKKISGAPDARTLWYAPLGDINKYYQEAFDGSLDLSSNFFVCTLPSKYDSSLAPTGCETLQVYIVAPFINTEYWVQNKDAVAELVINRLTKLMPKVVENIAVKESASPTTLLRYTNNFHGANYGWASTVEQSSGTMIRAKTGIKGLYITGHWATFGAGQGGTPMAAYAGKMSAQMVLRYLQNNTAIVL